MTTKHKIAFLEGIFAGNALVKTLKVLAFICFFVSAIFSVASMAVAQRIFGYREFTIFAGVGFVSGVIIFELAEVIRWLQKVFERFDLYDKIDR